MSSGFCSIAISCDTAPSSAAQQHYSPAGPERGIAAGQARKELYNVQPSQLWTSQMVGLLSPDKFEAVLLHAQQCCCCRRPGKDCDSCSRGTNACAQPDICHCVHSHFGP